MFAKPEPFSQEESAVFVSEFSLRSKEWEPYWLAPLQHGTASNPDSDKSVFVSFDCGIFVSTPSRYG
ncbi:hypothetical protein HMPREF9374_1604 [Desmospora sp. 8437]|nr:hypothetical protein HMPREF9374_1604 [Desmospora sp. 8437]